MEEKKKGSYITGFIGLIIGGLIATIPWILVYVYGNMIFSILSVLIAVGEFYGYTIFKGKPTKKLPIIIIVIAVLIVALTSLVIIPAFLIMKGGLTVSIASIKSLYASETFTSAILKDTGVAIVFTLFGAGAMSSYIKNKMNNANTIALNKDEIEKSKNEAIKKVKPIFKKFNALSAEHGIKADELNAEIMEKAELKEQLELLKKLKIVKKSKAKFFYDEEMEKVDVELKNNKSSNIMPLIIGILLVVTMVGVIILNQMGILNTQKVSNDNISFEVNGKWIEYQNYYTDVWTYYRYINTEEPAPDEEISENDFSKLPAYLNVSNSKVDAEELSSIQDLQKDMKEYVDTLETKPVVYEDSIEKSSAGYDVLKIKMVYDEEADEIEYLYYIVNEDDVAMVDAISYNMEDEQELEKTVETITESLKWIN